MADGSDYDIHYYFDPVCPFAWITSRWVTKVVEQRDYAVDWRFISLRLVNAHVDYDAQFPPEYEQGHTAGLKLLRVAAAARAEEGREAMGPLYTAMGSAIFDRAPDDPDQLRPGRIEAVGSVLESIGLSASYADALDDTRWDAEIQAETDEARERTGKDVGTPIIHYDPPDGVAFFGPVISRLPSDAQAVELWDHVVALAAFGGFAEMKRSLRELPQLRVLGVEPGEVGVEQDWHGGSRRLKK